MTANALVAAARLAAQAALVSPVGDDEAVRKFDAHLKREGVDASGLLRVPGAQSSVSTVIVDSSGERLIVNHRGNALVRAPAVDAAGWLAYLGGAHALLFASAAAAFKCQRAGAVLGAPLRAELSPYLQRLVQMRTQGAP